MQEWAWAAAEPAGTQDSAGERSAARQAERQYRREAQSLMPCLRSSKITVVSTKFAITRGWIVRLSGLLVSTRN